MTFAPGQRVRVSARRHEGHHRTPGYLKGRTGTDRARPRRLQEPRDARVRRRRPAEAARSTACAFENGRRRSTPTSRALAGGSPPSDRNTITTTTTKPHEPIGHDGESPAAARARALEELLVEKGVAHARGRPQREGRLARLPLAGRRRPPRRARLGRPGLQGAPARGRAGGGRRARARRGAVAEGRRAGEHRRGFTTWSSARSARAIPGRSSARRPPGTRACRTARAPSRSPVRCSREFGVELGAAWSCASSTRRPTCGTS